MSSALAFIAFSILGAGMGGIWGFLAGVLVWWLVGKTGAYRDL